MVDCSQFLDQYSEFRDGLLPVERMCALQEHLDDCASCARYDRVVEEGIRVFRDLPEVEPSQDFIPRLQHRLYHLEDEMRHPAHHASGTSVAFMLTIAAVIGVSAWMPAVRPRPAVVHLAPVVAHAPLRVEAERVLFRAGPLLTPPPSYASGTASASNLLFYPYSPVGAYVAKPASLRLSQ